MRWRLFFRDLTIVLGAVIVGGGIVYGIMQYKQMHTKQNSVLAAQTEVDTLQGQVGKLIELPKEIPTVATVSDINKLKDQPFFANAKNGDKVLIFVQAKEAILYRPSGNKIIKVSPVNTQETPTPSGVIPTITPIATVTPTAVSIKLKSSWTPTPIR
ncbi:MAG TPA: hypothetical protein VLF89_01880 [Candidatus Saccharimonadales bacterium]|nr:hypothetical protein [Candidatus Saccharimonadales bacterium]